MLRAVALETRAEKAATLG